MQTAHFTLPTAQNILHTEYYTLRSTNCTLHVQHTSAVFTVAQPQEMSKYTLLEMWKSGTFEEILSQVLTGS